MSETVVTAFLGDRARAFDLAPHLVELERVTGIGIGALVKRVVAGDFRADDLPSIIRLGLIGGGESPKDAAALVSAYVAGRPLAEAHELAVAIVMTLWAGKPKPVAVQPDPAEENDPSDGEVVITFPDGRTEVISAEATA